MLRSTHHGPVVGMRCPRRHGFETLIKNARRIAWRTVELLSRGALETECRWVRWLSECTAHTTALLSACGARGGVAPNPCRDRMANSRAPKPRCPSEGKHAAYSQWSSGFLSAKKLWHARARLYEKRQREHLGSQWSLSTALASFPDFLLPHTWA